MKKQRWLRNSAAAFGVVFALFTAFFWLGCGPTDGMAFALLCMWFGLPAAAFAVSAVWGAQGGRAAYALPLAFAVSEPLLDFCTFRLAACFAGNGLSAPFWSAAPIALAASAAGLAAGRLLRAFRRRRAA